MPRMQRRARSCGVRCVYRGGRGWRAASPAIYEIGGAEYVVYGFGNSAYNTSADVVVAFALPTAKTAAAAKAKAK